MNTEYRACIFQQGLRALFQSDTNHLQNTPAASQFSSVVEIAQFGWDPFMKQQLLIPILKFPF